MAGISSDGDIQFPELADRLGAGDPAAESLVVDRFTIQLVSLARRQLGERIRRKTAPEDAVQSAFKSFFKRSRRGQFDIGGWDGLWSLLALITVRKCAARRERYLSARRDVRREMPLSTAFVDGRAPCIPVSRGPLPEEALALIELVEQLLSGLSDGEQQIVLLRLQGYSIDEVCQTVHRADRTVRRVLARVRRRAMRLTNEKEGESDRLSLRPAKASRES
jgi:RNA polymerase sigma-70 factor (ECF subfamily)